jgi:cellulose synthase/poly-beta-1,6-N-acetylglucosamine synthase-like glycosyltransferase
LLLVSVVTVVFTLGYAAWMWYCYSGWRDMTGFKLSDNYVPSVSMTVIVPARNESDCIGRCISAILSQNYPDDLLQVIIADDHSEDDTAAVALQSGAGRVEVLRLSEAAGPSGLYKKKAIEMAVAQATGKLIVTTDADCTAGQEWLRTIAFQYESDRPKLMAGPVIFAPAQSLFERFQALDFAGMMVITGATIHQHFYVMCNGANLAYEREAFLAVDGYRGVDKHPSGDDMMLMHKIAKRYSGEIAFLKSKSAVVQTAPMSQLDEFLQQRFRWTSKASGYQDKRVSAVLAMVYVYNWLLLIATIAACFHVPAFAWVLPVWGVKLFSDFLILRAGSSYFGQPELMRVFWPAQIIHLLYIVVVGTLGNILPYTWKGRKVNR